MFLVGSFMKLFWATFLFLVKSPKIDVFGAMIYCFEGLIKGEGSLALLVSRR
jgi:hypothetical protein